MMVFSSVMIFCLLYWIKNNFVQALYTLDTFHCDKYMVVMLQLQGASCSWYNNNCINKLWDTALTFSIYTWFSWNYFLKRLKFSLRHYKLKSITLKSHWYFKLIEASPKLNPVKSFRKKCSSDSYLSYIPSLETFLSVVESCHSIS